MIRAQVRRNISGGRVQALVVLVDLATYAFRTSFGKQPIAHGSLVRDGYAEPIGNIVEN